MLEHYSYMPLSAVSRNDGMLESKQRCVHRQQALTVPESCKSLSLHAVQPMQKTLWQHSVHCKPNLESIP